MPKSERKSPDDSATLYKPGTIKTGNDGKKWIVAVIDTKNGPVQRWKPAMSKSSARATPKGRSRFYFTHDNGGRPFKVVLLSKSEVEVYKRSKPEEYDDDDNELDRENPAVYNTLCKRFENIQKLFIGKDVDDGYEGNSILLAMHDHQYVFIGERIYSFTTPDRDTIMEYYSLIGNSDVVYAVAVGKQNAYFMTGPNGGKACYVPLNMFDKDTDWMDGYREFYDRNANKKSDFAKSVKTVPHFKLLQKRLW